MNEYIAFSGGVDSTALALMKKDAIPVFTDTGWEFPELYEHINRFEKITGRRVIRIKDDESLPQYILRSKYLPGHGSRYCTRIFKIEPYNKFIRKNLPAKLSIGLRIDESDRIGNTTELDGLNINYPLRKHKKNRIDCLKICAKYELTPRYPLFMARGGCIGCFYKRKPEVTAIINLRPDLAKELNQLEKEVQDKRGKFALMFPNTGQSIQNMINQGELFTPEEIYQSAMQNEDVGVNCGLFCNR